MERDSNTEKRLNSHEGKLGAIEQAIDAFQIEKAKLGVIGKISVWVIGFSGTIFGGVVVGMVLYFINK